MEGVELDHPPGFRFFPTEEELIAFYLHNKLQGQACLMNRVIPVIDIYDVEPWQLPKLAGDKCGGDTEQWFFFCERQDREARGGRPNRTTPCGYWKATGSPGYVYSCDNRVIGVKKTMVFYKGKVPCASKTKWKMNEYRAIQLSHQSPIATPLLRNEFSVCRVYVVSGSCRAFDRRPCATASSYETSNSRGDHIPLMNYDENNDGIEEESSWELQEFNGHSDQASPLQN